LPLERCVPEVRPTTRVFVYNYVEKEEDDYKVSLRYVACSHKETSS
jgi:hypothetical protein